MKRRPERNGQLKNTPPQKNNFKTTPKAQLNIPTKGSLKHLKKNILRKYAPRGQFKITSKKRYRKGTFKITSLKYPKTIPQKNISKKRSQKNKT